MIKVTDSLDITSWSEFVHNHPHGTIFQSPEIWEVYKKTKNYTPVVLSALDDSDNIVALAQAVIIQETGGIVGDFTARSVMLGGPLYKNPEAVKDLIEKYNELVQKKAIYTQLRNLWDTGKIKDMLQQAGYVYEDHLNYLININRSEADIWQDVHKNRRKGIKRAERENIVVRRIESMSELAECYDIVRHTYLNARLPVVDISLFKAAYQILAPEGLADFYIALKNNESVGTRMVLKYKGIVHDWYAGSRKDITYVDEALVWQILRDNAGKYSIFEFGGAGHPEKEYGVREFKRRFGGIEVNFGRYQKVHSKIRKKIIEVGIGIKRTL